MINMSRLKKVRVVVSLLLFFVFTLIFTDFRNLIPEIFNKIYLYLQIIPSIIYFSSNISLAASGFIFILAVTLLWGRLYCSTICPLGTLQDVIYRISGKIKKNKGFRFKEPKNLTRYSILILSVIAFLFGYVLPITILDPFSNSGRIFSSLIKPVIIAINNSASSILENYDIFILYQVDYISISIISVIFSFVFLFILIWMSISGGRTFCNTLCPAGSLLAFFSKFSGYKIKFDEETCSTCGLCEKACKASCIDITTKNVDFTRCIACFNCFNACPSSALNYEPNIYRKKADRKPAVTDTGKRKLIFASFAGLFGLTGINPFKNIVEQNERTPVTPPGSINIKNFSRSCTACHLCVSQCPTGVLQPSLFEYGLSGMLQPIMDYHSGRCSFECVKCSRVCPTGAIVEIDSEIKKTTQIGVAKFLKEKCIVYTKGTACGACSEHCPTKSVKMVPYKNSLTIPKVNERICIGCGACELPCPVRPVRAIYVEGNPEHKTAEMPESSQLKKSDFINDDFPF